MKKKTGYAFFIGLFVILGVIIITGIILWLGANQFMKVQNYYVTYFDTSVEGLEKGSSVKYQGVTCGRISDIKVAPDGRLVEVIMQIELNININDSLRVQATMSGIAGGKFLQLHYPTTEMAQIYPSINFTPPYPLIKSAPSGFEEMTIAAQDVINNLLKLDIHNISNGMVRFLDNSNKLMTNQELFDIIGNLNQSSAMLVQVINKIDSSSVFANANATSELLLKTSYNLQMMVDTLTNQIVMMKLPQFVDKVYIKYDSLVDKTGNSINNLSYRSDAALLTIQETLEQIKMTNRSLQKTLRAISDNPSSIFLTEPPAKEK